MNKWEEKFPIGSVVYYFKKHGMDWNIEWGTVDSHYVDALCIQTYRPKDRRTINGIPYKDFVPEERRQKLPKWWSYDTMLYKWDLEDTKETDDDNSYFDWKNPTNILKFIANGEFIKTDEYDFSHIETDITKEGWKLRKTYYPYEHIPSNFISRPYNECYIKAQDAIDAQNKHDEEILRQRNLTDYEWSIEQIDKTLNRAQGVHLVTEDQADAIKQQLLKEDVENVETRIYMGKVQWKLWKNKRWMEIDY